MAETQKSTGGRQERRKAATRAKIQVAAEQLFSEKGYTETSIEDISALADVAMRTIYTHFPSKASIMLSYFDGWMDAFITEVLKRPTDEPIIETVHASLTAITEAGWIDRDENEDVRIHPLVEYLVDGPPDIAGHLMQRWMQELEHLTTEIAERGSFPAGSLEPRARAVAIFTAWVASISTARGREFGHSLPEGSTGNSLGLDMLALITGGTL